MSYYKSLHPDREDVLGKAVDACLDCMYKHAVPSISWEDYKTYCKEHPDDKHAMDNHYLPQEIYKEIQEWYAYAWGLDKKFEDSVEVVENYICKEATIDKYIEGENGYPGYRGYEKIPTAKDFLSKEDFEKVKNLFAECKKFYNRNMDYEKFLFTTMNYSPCSNKEVVERKIGLKINDTYSEIDPNFFIRRDARPDTERLGQKTFNQAYEEYPDIVDYLRGSKYDCFYDDSKIDDFLKELNDYLSDY